MPDTIGFANSVPVPTTVRICHGMNLIKHAAKIRSFVEIFNLLHYCTLSCIVDINLGFAREFNTVRIALKSLPMSREEYGRKQ